MLRKFTLTAADTTPVEVAKRAEGMGIRSIPAVVVDGTLADCCSGREINEDTLRAAGLSQSL
jgi:hypothetical protein